MRRILTALALAAAVAVSGCAQLQEFEQRIENAYGALSSAQVNYRDVTAGIAAFQGLQRIGTAYLRLPTCTASSGPVCHDRRATPVIKAAFRAGQKARNDVLAYMDAHPCKGSVCPLMPDGVYAGLRSAVSELQSIYNTYKVNLGG